MCACIFTVLKIGEKRFTTGEIVLTTDQGVFSDNKEHVWQGIFSCVFTINEVYF